MKWIIYYRCFGVYIITSLMLLTLTACSMTELKETMAKAKGAMVDKVSGKYCEGAVCYVGYSKDFQERKNFLVKGKPDLAYETQQTKLIEAKKEPNFLFSLESSLMALDANKLTEAIEHFVVAERLLKQRNAGTKAGDAGESAVEEIVKWTGATEYGKYEGESFERILMLNYKSIAHMLKGDRAAYNVTRRAIDQQNIEKKIFDKEMASVKEKTNEQMEEVEENQVEKKVDDPHETDEERRDIYSMIAKQYSQSKSAAMRVPSAFVNPFGFYMAGIVQEFDGFDDKSLRDNARISYKKALALNPKSNVLKQAVKEIQEKAPRGKRLVQIVVADGFAPEKKVVRFDLSYNNATIPVKLPLYEAVASAVDRIEVHTMAGERLASLSTVADIEAIILRHQLDSLQEQYLRAALDIARVVGESKLINNLAGKKSWLTMGTKWLRAETVNPDTRSWMTLPKQIMGARLVLPTSTTELQLVSFDKKGEILAKKSVTLDQSSHNFIYAHTLDKLMNVNQSEKLWVALK